MNKQKCKSVLAAMLVLALLLTALPGSVFASNRTEVELTDMDSSQVRLDALADQLSDAALLPEQTQPYAETDEVRILIAMAGPSAIDAGYTTNGIGTNRGALAHADGLERLHQQVIRDITANLITDDTFQPISSLTLMANAFTATARFGDLDELDAYLTSTYGSAYEGLHIVPQFEIMETDDLAEPQTMSATGMVGARSAWDTGYTGAGSRIAIIDTGLDTDHPSFDPEAFLYGLRLTAIENGKSVSDYGLLDEAQIEAVLDRLHATELYGRGIYGGQLTAADLYRNEKLAFAFNYVDQDLDVTHDNDYQGDHGTHVSGIATANTYIRHTDGNGADGFAPQENGVVGIAPDAQILIMKVFGARGGAYLDDYMLAIEDALLLGCDAVNLSLGSAVPGYSYHADGTYYQGIMDGLVGTDTVVSISGGNYGYWAQNTYADGQGLSYAEDVNMMTGGEPGSYTNSFTVASAVNTTLSGLGGSFAGVNVVVTEGTIGGSTAGLVSWTSLDTSGDSSGTDHPFVFLGDPTDPEDENRYGSDMDSYGNANVRDKIVLISRGGGSTFADKANYAWANGAKACVVYNNVEGSFGMDLTGTRASIPSVSIRLDEAMAILEHCEKNGDGLYAGTVTAKGKVVVADNPDGYTMSDFSSWGTTGNLAIKPEITAPGGNIYSTTDDGTYGINSGTSMAAPSIAGQVALVAQYIRENGLADQTELTRRALAISLLMSTATPLTDPVSGLPYSVRQQGAGLGNVGFAVTSPAYITMDPSSTASAADGKVKAELGDDPEKTGRYEFTFTIHNLSDRDLSYVTAPYVLTPEIVTLEGNDYMGLHEMALTPQVTFCVQDRALTYVYDLNEDGQADRLDAQLLNDYVAGTATLTQEQQSSMDLDSNGVITSVDVYLFLEALASGQAQQAARIPVPAQGSAEVTVTIALSQADRDRFAENNPNGGYVEGYIRLYGETDLSVPFLSFYGNFTDPSMFDRTTYVENYFGIDERKSYVSETNRVNFMGHTIWIPGEGYPRTVTYGFNYFSDDTGYDPQRNLVFSSGDSTLGGSLLCIDPCLIRQAALMKVEITNADTGEEYYADYTVPDVATYFTANAAWFYTDSRVYFNDGYGWSGTDAEGQPLADGTVIHISCVAAPELYTYLDENGERRICEDRLGQGAKWTTQVVIDSNAPTFHSAYFVKDVIGYNDYLDLTLQDNRHIAMVYLLNEDGRVILDTYTIKQETMGQSVELRMELADFADNVFTLLAVDYAGNYRAVRLDLSDYRDGSNTQFEEDTNVYAIATKNDGTLAWTTMNEQYRFSTVSGSELTAPLENAAYHNGRIYGNVGGSLYQLSATSQRTVKTTQLSGEYNFSDITASPTTDNLLIANGTSVLLFNPSTTEIYGSWDLATPLGGQAITGLAYAYSSTFTWEDDYGDTQTLPSVDWIAAITANGDFYQFVVYPSGSSCNLLVGRLGSFPQAATTERHNQGMMYNFNDGCYYYTVGTQIHKIGLDETGTYVLQQTIQIRDDIARASAMLMLRSYNWIEAGENPNQAVPVPQQLQDLSWEPAELQTVTGSLE